jgi:hypothetical protein
MDDRDPETIFAVYQERLSTGEDLLFPEHEQWMFPAGHWTNEALHPTVSLLDASDASQPSTTRSAESGIRGTRAGVAVATTRRVNFAPTVDWRVLDDDK